MSIMGKGLDPIGPLCSKRFLKYAWIIIILTAIVFLLLYKQGKLPKSEPIIDKIEETK